MLLFQVRQLLKKLKLYLISLYQWNGINTLHVPVFPAPFYPSKSDIKRQEKLEHEKENRRGIHMVLPSPAFWFLSFLLGGVVAGSSGAPSVTLLSIILMLFAKCNTVHCLPYTNVMTSSQSSMVLPSSLLDLLPFLLRRNSSFVGERQNSFSTLLN